MTTAVKIDNVSIVFGEKPEVALPLMDEGRERGEIQQETDQVLGVHNCSLDVQEGAILVLMGLSGSGKSTLLRAVNGLNPVVRGAVAWPRAPQAPWCRHTSTSSAFHASLSYWCTW